MNCSSYTNYQPIPFDIDSEIYDTILIKFEFIPAILSLFGALIILISYYMIRILREHPTFSYLIHLASLELISNIATIIQTICFDYARNSNDDPSITSNYFFKVAIISSTSLQFVTIIGSLIWTSLIALNIYYLTIYRNPINISKIYVILSYIAPLLLVLIFVGPQTTFLDLKPYQFYILFFSLIWICIIFNIIIYIKCAWFIKKIFNLPIGKDTFKTIGEFLWYPLILVCCWSINTIAASSVVIQCIGQVPFWKVPISLWEKIMIYIGGWLPKLQGFLNAWIYLRTPMIWQTIKNYFHRQEENSITSLDSDIKERRLNTSTTANEL